MAGKTITVKLKIDPDDFQRAIKDAIEATDWQKWLLIEAAALLGSPKNPHDECQTDAWKNARALWVKEYNRKTLGNAHITD